MKRKGPGRPEKWTPERMEQLLDKFIDYLYGVDEEGEYRNSIPSVSDFAFKNNISRQRLYEYEPFKHALEMCALKRERDLEMGGYTNSINTTMAVFALKQLGWTDKQEIEHSGSVTIIDDVK